MSGLQNVKILNLVAYAWRLFRLWNVLMYLLLWKISLMNTFSVCLWRCHFSFVFCCLPWILEMMQLFCLSCPLYWILSIIPNSFCEISFTLSVLYKTKWQGFHQNASLIFFGLCVWWKVLCLNEIQSITEMKFCHVPCTSNPLSLDWFCLICCC